MLLVSLLFLLSFFLYLLLLSITVVLATVLTIIVTTIILMMIDDYYSCSYASYKNVYSSLRPLLLQALKLGLCAEPGQRRAHARRQGALHGGTAGKCVGLLQLRKVKSSSTLTTRSSLASIGRSQHSVSQEVGSLNPHRLCV